MSTSSMEIEYNLRQNIPWNKLPSNVKQFLGNSQAEYEKAVVSFSVKNQLRFRGNLVSKMHLTEQRYYEELLTYSQTKLLLYPYHLSDMIVKGLRVTPFQYYLTILESIMEAEKSYDSLPNFTAADCLRLLGIGRNEYIDLMNQARSGRKLFRRKPTKTLLPQSPLLITIEPWWLVQIGCIMEEDIKNVKTEEKKLIDSVIDKGQGVKAGELDLTTVQSLYKKGLIYLDVPINDKDHIVVPPLEGFVMNRVLGDYFETLLYKIFVSIDEHTSVAELANVLQVDIEAVKNAVSLYCRLGFAHKKEVTEATHLSWLNYSPKSEIKHSYSDQFRAEPETELLFEATLINDPGLPTPCTEQFKPLIEPTNDTLVNLLEHSSGRSKRIAFLFDSTLTAFLMMGNLSPGLKNHAVTMFEVGKLSDESLPSLLAELERVKPGGEEGEAQRYFDHALVLLSTLKTLRGNSALGNLCLPVDLVRCESLQSLDPLACSRLLHKNYELLVSMAPLCKEVRPVSSCSPPHLGPAIPEINSPWFKMFLYKLTGIGPPSLLVAKGTRVRKLPDWLITDQDRLLVTVWGHDPSVIPSTTIIFTLNEALTHSPVLVQAYGGSKNGADTKLITFPDIQTDSEDEKNILDKVSNVVDLEHNCGYVTLIHLDNQWTLLDCVFGVPLFDAQANEKILSAVEKCQLWKSDSLSSLTQSSRMLCLRLLDFINQNQDKELVNPEDFISEKRSGKLYTVALPTKHLAFHNETFSFCRL